MSSIVIIVTTIGINTISVLNSIKINNTTNSTICVTTLRKSMSLLSDDIKQVIALGSSFVTNKDQKQIIIDNHILTDFLKVVTHIVLLVVLFILMLFSTEIVLIPIVVTIITILLIYSSLCRLIEN